MENRTFAIGDGTLVSLNIGCYVSNPTNIAIQLVEAAGDDAGMNYSDLTVNLGSDIGNETIMPRSCGFIDVNNFPAAERFIAENGLGTPYKRFGEQVYGYSGYCEYPLYRFDEEALKQCDPQGFKAYAGQYSKAFAEELDGFSDEPEKLAVPKPLSGDQQMKVLVAMHAAGYSIVLDSCSDISLQFISDRDTVAFKSWAECESWLEHAGYGYPEADDEVAHILHPERFADEEAEHGYEWYAQMHEDDPVVELWASDVDGREDLAAWLVNDNESRRSYFTATLYVGHEAIEGPVIDLGYCLPSPCFDPARYRRYADSAVSAVLALGIDSSLVAAKKAQEQREKPAEAKKGIKQ